MSVPPLPQIYRLSDEQSAQLVNQPETGMGYQLIHNTTGSEVLVALNAEVLLAFPQGQALPILLDPRHLTEAAIEPYQQLDLRVIPNPKYVASQALNTGQPAQSDASLLAALDVLPKYAYNTRLGDVFVRVSAFEMDKRVLEGGGLAPGTFVTTLSDLQVVPSGVAAVGRYALPNTLTARYTFKINPPANVPVQFGTVVPNYGQSGGGAEVYIADGLQPGHVHIFGTIPAM